MGTERGQALMELMVGMTALALVVAVLAAFAVGIVKSLREQNDIRAGGGSWRIENRVDLPGDLWTSWSQSMKGGK